MEKFGKASGLTINRAKTSIIFSRNVKEDLKREIKDICNYQEQPSLGKYLGAMITNHLAGKENYKNILERHSIVPKDVLLEIEKSQRRFVWREIQTQRKVHLVGWDTMCMERRYGGLSFKSLEKVNEAFQMKIIWRILKEPEALWVQVLSHKYTRYSDSHHAFDSKKANSMFWRDINKIW
ncbi:uncharacterized mitochondrial protein AtMg00310-like [Arachis hypogaea]|uniref:uncharacterized mitochondrial protein AtMg00310-like n=1 Tax=Arachis hypogaea TaxID=3818 RepID=UPI003B21A936